MNVIAPTIEIWRFNRERTLGLLDAVEATGKPREVLAWRPGPGRAHIAWQLMHVAVTEELFATERLTDKSPAFAELVPRFRGGSTPDEAIPTAEEIRAVLGESRQHLLETIGGLSEADLDTIPPALAERGWTIGTVLQVLAWHEPHHQGQAHAALNLWKAANA